MIKFRQTLILILVASVIQSTFGFDDGKDLQALLELFKSAGGSNWENNKGWGINDKYCTWYGIACDDDGWVVTIHLTANGLSGTVDAVSKMPRLTNLILSDNGITGSPPVLTSNDSLFYDLSFNKLTGPFNMDLFKKHYQYLDLSFNLLQTTVPTTGFWNIKHVNMAGNQLFGMLPLLAFSDGNGIQYLNLSHNQFRNTIPPFSFGNSLQVVDLSYNQLTGNIPSSLGFNSNPGSLYLQHNHLSTIDPDLNVNITNNQCDLSGNPFICVNLPQWAIDCHAGCFPPPSPAL